ncbi:MAG: S8 family serine peptidase [Lachnospiraceae bacterium]|nr:S8 family serine peptidase [Lachnospiraceae bacterium]
MKGIWLKNTALLLAASMVFHPFGAVKAGATEKQTTLIQTTEIQAANTQTTRTQATDAWTTDTQTEDSQAAGTQAADSQTTDNLTSDSQTTDTQTADSQTSDSQTEDSLTRVNSGQIITDQATSNQETADVSATLLEEAKSLESLEEGKDYVPEQGFFYAKSLQEAESVASEYGGRLISFRNEVGVLDLGQNVRESLTQAADKEGISTPVYPDLYMELCDIPNDPYYTEDNPNFTGTVKQWQHHTIGTISANELSNGEGVTVAVLDTGVNTSQYDLSGNRIVAKSILGDDGEDTQGHGTHVTGIIAANWNNGEGGFGLAPKVNIESIKITDASSILTSNIIRGIKQAIADEVNVISMSLGGTSFSQATQLAVNEAANKGITIVAAAGNGVRKDNSNVGTDTPNYPAACNNVISVAAYDSAGSLATFSNYGSTVDIAAPGTNIWSTYITPSNSSGIKPSNSAKYEGSENHYYSQLSGTSQATPIVAGTIALMYAANPIFLEKQDMETTAAISDLLIDNTDGKTYANAYGSVAGGVDALKAVTAAKAYSDSHNYSLVDPNGFYGSYQTGYIGWNKSLKLKIGDKTGNVKDKAVKKAAKTATFESDNPTVISVSKKGKVKCLKNAHVNQSAIITATIGDEKLYYQLTVREATKKFSYCIFPEAFGGKYTFKSSYLMTVSKNTAMDLRDPYSLTSNRAFLLTYTSRDSAPTVAADSSYRYRISVSKKQLKMLNITSTQKNGDPAEVVFSQTGIYKFKYKTTDGSNKSFTLKVKVE